MAEGVLEVKKEGGDGFCKKMKGKVCLVGEK